MLYIEEGYGEEEPKVSKHFLLYLSPLSLDSNSTPLPFYASGTHSVLLKLYDIESQYPWGRQ